jgi:hypothetical protein
MAGQCELGVTGLATMGQNLARNAARRGFASRSTTGPPPAPASCWSATATRASCRDVLDRGVRGRPGPAAAHPGDGEGRPARKTRSAAIDTSRTARKVSSSSGPWGDTTAITRNTTRARRASAARGQRVNGPPGSRRVLGTGVCASSGMRFTIARCRHTRYPVGGLRDPSTYGTRVHRTQSPALWRVAVSAVGRKVTDSPGC